MSRWGVSRSPGRPLRPVAIDGINRGRDCRQMLDPATLPRRSAQAFEHSHLRAAPRPRRSPSPRRRRHRPGRSSARCASTSIVAVRQRMVGVVVRRSTASASARRGLDQCPVSSMPGWRCRPSFRCCRCLLVAAARPPPAIARRCRIASTRRSKSQRVAWCGNKFVGTCRSRIIFRDGIEPESAHRDQRSSRALGNEFDLRAFLEPQLIQPHAWNKLPAKD